MGRFYKGNTEICKVYKGSTLVYSCSSNLKPNTLTITSAYIINPANLKPDTLTIVSAEVKAPNVRPGQLVVTAALANLDTHEYLGNVSATIYMMTRLQHIQDYLTIHLMWR